VGRSVRPDDFPKDIEYLQNDCSNSEVLSRNLKSVTSIIDLSYTTTPKTSFDNPLSDLISNLPRAISLFDAARTLKKLEKFVVVSSGGTVYGEVDTYPIKEHATTRPVSPYGITKLTIEKYAHLYQKNYGLPTIILRPANAYGPKKNVNDSQGFITVSFSKILSNKAISVFGEQGSIRDYIYIDDVTSAFVAALQKGVIGKTYNIGTGQGINNAELLKLISQVVSVDNFKVKHSVLESRSFDVSANVLNSNLFYRDTKWRPKVPLLQGLQITWQEMKKK
jgi:UDP-glucose 4-epimerase